jgi:hypothetical protein
MKLGECFGHDDLLAHDQSSGREMSLLIATFEQKKIAGTNSAIKEEK